MSKVSDQIILALETAVRGGSISIFKNGVEIASICGAAGVSRAEDLITNIDQLLDSSGVSRCEVSTVAASTGPGSYTGIRIGLSTAIGLAESLDAAFIGVNVLTAMCQAVEGESAVVSAVPTGSDEAAWEAHFEHKGNMPGDTQIGAVSDLVSSIKEGYFSVAILHRSLITAIQDLNAEFPPTLELIDAGDNLATFIGRSASLNLGSQDIKPIYLLNPARRNGLF